MFPGSHAQVYRNEAGEVVGWDYAPEPDYRPDLEEFGRPEDWCKVHKQFDCDECDEPA